MQVQNVTRGKSLASRLRVAHTAWTRMRGLLGCPPLQSGEGLWIRPSQGVHTFGMKYPIDVLFLNSKKHVVGLYENLQPYRVTKIRFDTRSVIELPALTISQSGTRIGDQIEIGGDP